MNPQAAQSFDIPLNDIKPLAEVPDSSFAFFIAVVAVGVLAVGVLGYFLWRLFRRNRAKSARKAAYEALGGVDFSDAKEAAYAISRYGLVFADDEPRIKEAYEKLTQRLAAYKYRKTVPEIDDETIGYYKIYVEMIDV